MLEISFSHALTLTHKLDQTFRFSMNRILYSYFNSIYCHLKLLLWWLPSEVIALQSTQQLQRTYQFSGFISTIQNCATFCWRKSCNCEFMWFFYSILRGLFYVPIFLVLSVSDFMVHLFYSLELIVSMHSAMHNSMFVINSRAHTFKCTTHHLIEFQAFACNICSMYRVQDNNRIKNHERFKVSNILHPIPYTYVCKCMIGK